jgi:hypothetical protein
MTSWGPFHNKQTANKWKKILEVENPVFKNKLTLMPLNYVNTNPFSSATMEVTKVKNNRKRVNKYEYIEA